MRRHQNVDDDNFLADTSRDYNLFISEVVKRCLFLWMHVKLSAGVTH